MAHAPDAAEDESAVAVVDRMGIPDASALRQLTCAGKSVFWACGQPLRIAAANDQLPVLLELVRRLDSGSLAHLFDVHGREVVYHAARAGSIRVLAAMVELVDHHRFGASVYNEAFVRAVNGNVCNDFDGVVRVLVGAKACLSRALQQAVIFGTVEDVVCLLRAKADEMNHRPLLMAAWVWRHPSHDMVLHLLRLGIGLGQVSEVLVRVADTGMLSPARRADQLACGRVLLAFKADPGAALRRLATIPKQPGDELFVQLLLAAGAKVNAAGTRGDTSPGPREQ